ncbi:hypothetical protein AX14_006347 [Amanita brunnescens Koide BX004]|nr:hypothetical protein AX14_006347 [Amanita brunnescens Koide BX004]
MKRTAQRNDLSRVLDPSYAPPQRDEPPAVIVDTHGYLHDPDYRHFPAIPTPAQPDDDDATPQDTDFYSLLSSAYNRAGNAYVHPRKRNNQYSYIYASYRSPYHYFTPTTASSSSPPTSFDSDATVFDEADDSTFDDSHSHVGAFKKKLSKRRSSGSSSSHSPTNCSPFGKRKSTEERRSSCSVAPEPSPRMSSEESRHRQLSPHDELDEQYLLSSHTPPPNHDSDPSHQQSHPESEKHDQQEWTPTCTQNLRRQWQALSLQFRFSIFRAQRRVKRRIQGLI